MPSRMKRETRLELERARSARCCFTSLQSLPPLACLEELIDQSRNDPTCGLQSPYKAPQAAARKWVLHFSDLVHCPHRYQKDGRFDDESAKVDVFAKSSTCPTTHQLLSYILAALSQESAKEIISHLDICTSAGRKCNSSLGIAFHRHTSLTFPQKCHGIFVCLPTLC